jgi:hypothetical protein
MHASIPSIGMPILKAVGRYSTHRIQITKLCNNLLPTARWANWYDSLTTFNCLQCGEPEDHDHILLCHHPTCKQWRINILVHLHKAQDTNESDPQLLDILLDGLHSWFDTNHLTLAHYLPHYYHGLIHEQTKNGWRHLFNGHMSYQWRILQDRYVWQQKIHTVTYTGAGWTLRTLAILWNDFFLLWASRNAACCHKLGFEMVSFTPNETKSLHATPTHSSETPQPTLHDTLILQQHPKCRTGSTLGSHLSSQASAQQKISPSMESDSCQPTFQLKIPPPPDPESMPHIKNPRPLPRLLFRSRCLKSFFGITQQPTHPP